MKVKVELSGCDDHTDFYLDTDVAGLRLLETASALSEVASTHGCQPRLYVEVIPEEEK